MRKAGEIRAEFIDFFKARDHAFVPSTPVVPAGDPTLLFVNAGMVQFKDVFLGTGTRNYTRAVNSQKCIRVSGKHNDLEVVGLDTYHHTFFEMLGNWSFGDYGKEEAIVWAWELLTEVWGLSKDRLYATIHLEDDEAEGIWRSHTDLIPERIFRFDKDNFWEMGDVGPCGPCSEIHIDLGLEPGGAALAADPKTGINSGSDRFVELWNLVFIRFERLPDSSLVPLKQTHVDTGMGFERICAVLQGKSSNFETDIFLPLIERLSEISGVDYEGGAKGTAHRVIADHVRMLTFALADGAIPSNEGRGYVVRRILRRAARFGRELGVRGPFIYRIVSTVVDLMGKAYPEIVKRAQHVSQVIKAEEESFGVTLDRGLELFENVALAAEKTGIVDGRDAFTLYDTYGFPLDLTVMMARERNLKVDKEQFDSLMQGQRTLSRARGKFITPESEDFKGLADSVKGKAIHFVGYDRHTVETELIGGNEKNLVLDQTPFYAEGGGQVADQGVIKGEGFKFLVKDVQRSGDLILHLGEFAEGGLPSPFKPPVEVKAEIDLERRLATARNHTATHLLHRALLQELGESATQAGSFVSPDYLRFDFHHYEKVAEELLLAIEKKVNAQIRTNRPLVVSETDYEKAVAQGALALFGEKYESRVRVVEVQGFSKELCGGTHVSSTGQIGSFVITAETSVATGIRRIEAFTGERATDYLLQRSHIVSEIERMFSVKPGEIFERFSSLIETQKTLSRELAQFKGQVQKAQVDDLLKEAESLPDGLKVVGKVLENFEMEELKGMGDSFREKCPSGAALFASEKDRKIIFVCAVTDDLVSGGKLKAGELVSRIARIAGGGGGGRDHLATAGGKRPEKLDEAVSAFVPLVREMLSQ
ncbi:MAG TPA: alanine--tRNA ligase [archaeon]|nr:alanine--tRNA ligase [archaeon]